jgi:hypothetical protein
MGVRNIGKFQKHVNQVEGKKTCMLNKNVFDAITAANNLKHQINIT